MKIFKKDIHLGTHHVRKVIDGTFFYKSLIRKNMIYIIFCTILLLFHIGNRYKTESQLTEIAKLEKEITDLRYESITTSAELMSMSRQSKVHRLVKQRGISLEESIEAPRRIYIKN